VDNLGLQTLLGIQDTPLVEVLLETQDLLEVLEFLGVGVVVITLPLEHK
jgi:hypothetical protein